MAAVKSWDDIDGLIKQIGLLDIKRDRLEGKMNEAITKIKEQYGPQIAQHNTEIELMAENIKDWCDDHRTGMQQARKDAGLTWRGVFGKVAFRKCPPSVIFLKKAEKVLALLQAMQLTKFIRKAEEPNKEAMHLLTDEQLEQVGARRQPAERFEVKPDYKEIAAREDAA